MPKVEGPDAKGFTMIELLVVIAITAFLAAVGLTSYTVVQKNGRDTKRHSDLRIIQSALEQYRSEQFVYPLLTAGTGLPCPTNGNFKLNCPLKSPDGSKTFWNLIPSDPDAAALYQYSYSPQPSACDNSASKCNNYCLYANMENTSNSAATPCSFPGGYDYVVTPP